MYKTALILHAVIFSKKRQLKNLLLGLIKDLKAKYGIHVQYARCDNAGENGDFEMACKQDSPGTPQQKSHAELKLLPSLIRYMPSSMEESFHPF